MQDLSVVKRVVPSNVASSNSDLSNNVTTTSTTHAPMITNLEQDAEIVENLKKV